MFLSKAIIFLFSFGVARPANFSTNAMANLPKKMKAVGLYKYLPISDPNSLIDIELELPTLKDNEILVEVKAISVNPIDTKQRAPKPTVEEKPRVLGWDGSGIIVAAGKRVSLHKVATEVFFTGDLRQNGSDAQYVALNEILAAPKPKNLTFEQAGAMALTSATAYEAIFDRLLISEDGKDKNKSLLIINSAGGVGSVASQLAKLAGLKVIGTASRPETTAFSLEFGADIVLNHTQDLLPQLAALGYEGGVDYILVNFDPYSYWDTLMKAIKPQGKICLVVDCSGLVDIRPLKDKSVTLVSELMSTRLKYDTEDKIRHHDILKKISSLLEKGSIKTTLTKTLSPINATNLREAHRLLEEKHMIGKLVLYGF